MHHLLSLVACAVRALVCKDFSNKKSVSPNFYTTAIRMHQHLESSAPSPPFISIATTFSTCPPSLSHHSDKDRSTWEKIPQGTKLTLPRCLTSMKRSRGDCEAQLSKTIVLVRFFISLLFLPSRVALCVLLLSLLHTCVCIYVYRMSIYLPVYACIKCLYVCAAYCA